MDTARSLLDVQRIRDTTANVGIMKFVNENENKRRNERMIGVCVQMNKRTTCSKRARRTLTHDFNI